MTAPTARPAGRLPKLRPGQLRAQVLAHLAATPNKAFTPGEVAAALGGRSSGAVGQALDRLTRQGWAERGLHSPPQRFQITPAGVTAANRPAPPAASGPTAATPPRRSGPVRRPNGTWYHPRRLADGTDIDVLRKLRDRGIPALLYGPPGTGKTSLVEAAFPDVLTVAGNGDTCVEDLLGSYTPQPDGTFTYAHGPLVTAMREGRALLVDDATLISPKVLAVLYPAMDGRATITIPAHHHETVTAAPGFYVIAGHNPGVHGAILTEALASRFAVHIEVTTDLDLARTLGVPPRAVQAAATLNAQLKRGEVGWAPQVRELLAFARIADTIGTAAAVANLITVAPEEDRDAVAKAVHTAFGYTPTPLTLGQQIR